MYKLRLIKGLSYSGAVFATRSSPFVSVENKDIAEKLIADGYFELVEAEKKPAEYKELSLDELKSIATERGIDITSLKKKADIVKAITDLEADNAECEADYGECDVDNS